MFLSKTWKTLQRGNLTSPLYLCVPDEEFADYRAAIGTERNIHLIGCPERSLVKQRQYIRKILPENYPIVFIDDDVDAIKVLQGEFLYHCEDIENLVSKCFDGLIGNNALMWGIYPMCNKGWMSDTIYVKNAYCPGCFYGIINTAMVLEPDRDELEDFSRQLSEQAEGRNVLRYNHIGVTTKYFLNPGGLQVLRNTKTREEAVDAVVMKFPTLVKKVEKRGVLDLKFLGRPEKAAHET